MRMVTKMTNNIPPTIAEVQKSPEITDVSINYDGKRLLFLQDAEDDDGRNRKPRIHISELDGSNVEIIPIDLDDDEYIDEMYVSPHHPLLMVKRLKGKEKGRLWLYNLGDDYLPIDRTNCGERELFGRWNNAGFDTFRFNSDEKKWELCSYKLGTWSGDNFAQNNYKLDYPAHMGWIDETPVIIEQNATFNNSVVDGDLLPKSRRRCPSIFCNTPHYIREEYGGHHASIVNIHLKDEKYDEKEIFTTKNRKEFLQGEYPHGELEDWKPIDECKIMLHYNRDGCSEFWIYNTKEEKVVSLKPSSKELKDGFWAKSFIVSGENLFIVLSSPSMSDQIWRINHDTREETLLTKPSLNLEVESQSTKKDLLNDGIESQWYEHTPTGESQGTVLFLHGGPAVQSRFEWKREVASFLSRRMRVIVFNPRGGLGRGAEFAALDDYHPDDGSKPRRVKVIDETKHLIRMEKKLCLYGGSYGGWLVHKILADEEDLGIVAAGTRNGIFNMGTFLENTADWRRAHREIEYGPMKLFQNDGTLSCLNVSRFIHAIPLKIIGGAADKRVPVEQSVTFIKNDGGPSDCSMLVYANEGHKIKRLDNRIESISWIADLFHSCWCRK